MTQYWKSLINISRGDDMQDMPYFMTDKQWYTFDFDKRMFVLTEHAPDEAKESYDEYLKNRKHPK